MSPNPSNVLALGIPFTPDECRAIYHLLDTISGGNARDVFTWDGQDDIANPTTRAALKVFLLSGQLFPQELQEKLNDVIAQALAPVERVIAAQVKATHERGIKEEREACANMILDAFTTYDPSGIDRPNGETVAAWIMGRGEHVPGDKDATK